MGCAAGVKQRQHRYFEGRPDSLLSGESFHSRKSQGSSTTELYEICREPKRTVTTQERHHKSFPSEQRPQLVSAKLVSAKESDSQVDVQKKACGRAEAILKKERTKSNDLWRSLDDEVSLAVQRWKSTGRWNPGEKKTRVLVDLQAAVVAKDVSAVGTAMHHVGKLGSLQVRRLQELQDELIAQEEAEGTWQCLVSALKNVDRFVLRFWLDEADGNGIDVPSEVIDALRSLEGKARGAVQKYSEPDHRTTQAEFDARVVEAQSKGDGDMLQRLASAAGRFGADPDFAKATIEAMKLGTQADEKTCPERRTLDPELADVVSMSNERLQLELQKHGIELGIAEFDRQDLVQLVCAARTMSRMSASRHQPSGHLPQQRFTSAADGCYFHAQRTSSSHDIPDPQSSLPVKSETKRAAALACLALSAASSLTEEGLRRAYKTAALKWHPDRQQNRDCQEEAKRKFQEIHEAYEFLRNSL